MFDPRLCMRFDYPDYVPDRLFEAPGRDAFQIFPRVPGIDQFLKDGEEVVFCDFENFAVTSTKGSKNIQPGYPRG